MYRRRGYEAVALQDGMRAGSTGAMRMKWTDRIFYAMIIAGMLICFYGMAVTPGRVRVCEARGGQYIVTGYGSYCVTKPPAPDSTEPPQ